ncbi:hypothetical protein [Paenibacillus senegalensis]|nr:hypothetical protein [Paenibacillus senegalensis]
MSDTNWHNLGTYYKEVNQMQVDVPDMDVATFKALAEPNGHS